MQLVGDVRSPALQRHFLGMAKVWATEAENGPARPPVDVPTAGPSAPDEVIPLGNVRARW